jgi:hypothetical protein
MKTALFGQRVVLECLESVGTASSELMRELEEWLEENLSMRMVSKLLSILCSIWSFYGLKLSCHW